METYSLYNLSVESVAQKRIKTRVGLLHRLTGVPVFVIFLNGIDRVFSISSASFEKVDAFLQTETDPFNQEAWRLIRDFFESGGTHSHICVSPLSGETSAERLACLIGGERSFGQRTGLHTLKNAVDRADLVVVPQAPSLLNPRDYQIFCRALGDLIATLPNFFALLDLPKGLEPNQAVEWSSPLSSEDSALFYPWIIREDRIRPSVPLIAAAYQKSDRQFGISDNPSNRPLPELVRPLIRLIPDQVSTLNQNRINTLLKMDTRPALIWGSKTLAPKVKEEYFSISTRRTIKALGDSISTICEIFVLEPLQVFIQSIVAHEIEDFCLVNRSLFNSEQKKPYRVQAIVQEDGHASGLEVHCEFFLNTCVESLQLSIGMRS